MLEHALLAKEGYSHAVINTTVTNSRGKTPACTVHLYPSEEYVNHCLLIIFVLLLYVLPSNKTQLLSVLVQDSGK